MEEPVLERQELSPTPRVPILRTETAVSYLGVRLPRAENTTSPFVPKKEAFGDYIDDQFSLEMQRNFATAFSLGQPILVEGGTSIGKTTTGRKMAAELGWEVHYVNLNGATDVEDLMGRYIPNPNRKYPEDPEYIFADGKVTSGLRQEEGKVKLVILDEFNSANPNIVIRIHEVLDALDRGGQVVLSEDASETLTVSREKTKIMVLTNPPGKGYIGREPLDKAQLRRWTYYKAASELPAETASRFTKAIFGLASQIETVPDEVYLFSADQALLPEQLPEIPGITEIIDKYNEFHEAAKQLLKERQIAADQPQQFTFDDRNERIRVRNFVLNFYRGDINETFQDALRFYYSNKLESAVDKAKLEELIVHVEYRPPVQNTLRRQIEIATERLVMESVHEASRGESEVVNEQNEWRRILGASTEVAPLPASITPEVRRNLERMGLVLRFIPQINLITAFGGLRDVQEFLTTLKDRFPNWKPYESLNDREKANPDVVRNLNRWYWEQVKDRKIDFPQLPGTWIAVEKMPKPAYRSKYEVTPMSTKLGFPDRFNVSWNDANQAINRKKTEIIDEIGLLGRGTDVRMLRAIEWNLLANREGWGKTDTYEWVEDTFRGAGGSGRLMVGGSGLGGAAGAGWDHPDYSSGHLGFRVAVVLGT